MSKTSIKSLYYFIIIIIVSLILFLPRGTTVDDSSLKTDTRGEVNLVLEPDAAYAPPAVSDKIPSLYRQQLVKSDYIFIAYYRYNVSFDLTAIPRVNEGSLTVKADMPGSITDVEGGQVKEGQAVFSLALGQKNNLSVRSAQIRWIWVIIFIVLFALAGLFYLLKRQYEKL